MDKISACVILYNPNSAVVENITTYKDYVEKVYVIDNSEVNNNVLTEQIKQMSSKIHYISNNANLGIAKALNIAAEIARNNGYKWLLTMDQDSNFSELMIKNYVEAFKIIENKEKIAVIAVKFDKYKKIEKIEVNDYGYSEVMLPITSGNLLNLEIHNKVEGFEEKLFIDSVDLDYCLKCLSKGYKVIEMNQIYLNHSLGEIRKICNIFGKPGFIIVHSYKRVYYMARNTLYLYFKYKKFYPIEMRKVLIGYFLPKMKNIVLHEEDKGRKIWYYFGGIIHYFIGRFGRI